MTISQIRLKWLRRTVVVLTVAAIVVTLTPLWLLHALEMKVRETFGEDIRDAWDGDNAN